VHRLELVDIVVRLWFDSLVELNQKELNIRGAEISAYKLVLQLST